MWWMFFNILWFLIDWTINQLIKKTMRREGDKKVSDKCSLEQTHSSNCDWLCADLDAALHPDPAPYPPLAPSDQSGDWFIHLHEAWSVVCFRYTSQKQIMKTAHHNTVRATDTQLLFIKQRTDRKSSQSTRFESLCLTEKENQMIVKVVAKINKLQKRTPCSDKALGVC